jgi:hypothetical protein
MSEPTRVGGGELVPVAKPGRDAGGVTQLPSALIKDAALKGWTNPATGLQ